MTPGPLGLCESRRIRGGAFQEKGRGTASRRPGFLKPLWVPGRALFTESSPPLETPPSTEVQTETLLQSTGRWALTAPHWGEGKGTSIIWNPLPSPHFQGLLSFPGAFPAPLNHGPQATTVDAKVQPWPLGHRGQ